MSVALSNSALRKRLALSYCFFLPTFLVRVHPLASAWLQLVRFTVHLISRRCFSANQHSRYLYLREMLFLARLFEHWYALSLSRTGCSYRMSRNYGNRESCNVAKNLTTLREVDYFKFERSFYNFFEARYDLSIFIRVSILLSSLQREFLIDASSNLFVFRPELSFN